MSFIFYDIIFLILFVIGVAAFLYKHRKNVEVESKIIFLYKTRMGLDTIDRIGKKYPRFLNFMSYLIIATGYVMMTFSFLFLIYFVYFMIKSPVVSRVIPIMPLVPYVTSVYPNLPPFYFTYWIIVIAIIAVGHEFSHGIFARLNKVRLKSTGFGFIGPLLAAFVEVDEKQMAQKPLKAQLSVLAAGSFANLTMALVFLILMNGFFVGAYHANGLIFQGAYQPNFGSTFSTYALDVVNVSSIYAMNGAPVNNFYSDYQRLKNENITQFEFMAKNKSYFGDKNLLGLAPDNSSQIVLYDDSPLYRANVSAGLIQEIDSKDKEYKIRDLNDLKNAFKEFSPGEEMTIRSTSGNYTLTLGEDPANSSEPYLGMAFIRPNTGAFSGFMSFFVMKETFVFYEPKSSGIGGDLIVFIYDLLYWIVLINFSVMVVNMLPFAIFDGGRFFYLSVLGISSRKTANRMFRLVNWLMLAFLAGIMGIWAVRTFF